MKVVSKHPLCMFYMTEHHYFTENFVLTHSISGRCILISLKTDAVSGGQEFDKRWEIGRSFYHVNKS
jgi:hypothetical protein